MSISKSFKAIVVGGSVSGLTLAHCFEKAGIKYTLLEARDTISPQSGASIVIMPNGARILDQMGILEPMTEFMEKMQKQVIRRSDGRKVSENEWPRLVEEKLGYQCGLCERKLFLQSLYDQLKDKTPILLEKKVVKIEQSKSEVSVICSDGTHFTGDIVIGADGIHSRTRREMQMMTDDEGQVGLMGNDKTNTFAEYNCMFGISEVECDLDPGDSAITTDLDHSSLLFVGKNAIPQWFFVSKMDKKYFGDEIPRFAKAQMEQLAEEHKDYHFTKTLTLKHLVSKSKVISFLALEEAHYEMWVYRRMACVGDAIHKMTPNAGQGGNQAIESAAVLTNCLIEILTQKNQKTPEQKDVESALLKYQDIRQDRARKFVQLSGVITRNDSLSTLRDVLRFLYKEPISGEMFANIQVGMFYTAPFLNFLPLPKWVEENPLWVEGIEKMKEGDNVPTGAPYKPRL